jgi:CRAL/TRIO domain
MFGDLIAAHDDNTVVGGQTIICDFQNATFAHLAQWQIGVIKKLVILWQEASPLRQKGIHLINSPPGVDQIVKIFMAFTSEKIKSRVRFLFYKFSII